MSKKIYVLFVSIALLSTLAIPAFAANFNPNKLYGAPSYVLNIIGKKAGWSGGGTYDNPDRHTIFVPETSVHGTGSFNGTTIQTNTTMWITQGAEFAVLDGSSYDEDGDVDLQLGPGKYAVFVVALGKPGGTANIKGWIYNATDNTYLLMVGMISVSRINGKPQYVNATDLLYVSDAEDPYGLVTDDVCVFDYLAQLEGYAPAGEYLYLWDLDMNNCKHLQVRFYKTG
jgi:hypothetical protein